MEYIFIKSHNISHKKEKHFKQIMLLIVMITRCNQPFTLNKIIDRHHQYQELHNQIFQ